MYESMVLFVGRGSRLVEKKKSFFTKANICHILLIVCDIVLVIYCARNNKVHYVKMFDENVLVGNTKDMLLGRNYINVIISCFFYIYMLLIERFFLHRRVNKKTLIRFFVGVWCINLLLFFVFTQRIY